MLTQSQLARALTSREDRRRLQESTIRPLSPVSRAQLELTARIAENKRYDYLARWFPATASAAAATPTLRSTFLDAAGEPLPLHGPNRRLACGDVLVGHLTIARGDRAASVLKELLRLEMEILRLTYHPTAAALARQRAERGTNPPPICDDSRLRVPANVVVMRFDWDVLALRDGPQNIQKVVTEAEPVGVALQRHAALRPVAVLRLGSGAARLLEAVGHEGLRVGEARSRIAATRPDQSRQAITRALAHDLLEIA